MFPSTENKNMAISNRQAWANSVRPKSEAALFNQFSSSGLFLHNSLEQSISNSSVSGSFFYYYHYYYLYVL